MYAELIEQAAARMQYFTLRAEHPDVPARAIHRYVRQGPQDGESDFEQAMCGILSGHTFACTGTEYGGDDERWHGEGRSLCSYCGADGDA